MRTPGQGQAAVPEERVNRRRSPPPAWAGGPGPRDKILRTVTFVERYQRSSCRGFLRKEDIRFCHGRASRSWFFVAQAHRERCRVCWSSRWNYFLEGNENYENEPTLVGPGSCWR